LPKRIIVLSGRVSAGKSTLADGLSKQFQAHVLKTKDVIEGTAKGGIASERGAMQDYGELLDRKTGGDWVAKALTREMESLSADAVVVVDAVRIVRQVRAIRRAYGSRVVHIHLNAALPILEDRYRRKQRQKDFQEFESYSDVLSNKTERGVDRLAQTADVLIDTERCTREDVVVRAAARLGLYGREHRQLVDVLVGGSYGSEGKGHIASYLAPEYDILLRVGGPNAGHKVYEDPPYIHHLLPSGTRRCNAALIIAPGAVLTVPQFYKKLTNAR